VYVVAAEQPNTLACVDMQQKSSQAQHEKQQQGLTTAAAEITGQQTAAVAHVLQHRCL
jgi:hypothetical protein